MGWTGAGGDGGVPPVHLSDAANFLDPSDWLRVEFHPSPMTGMAYLKGSLPSSIKIDYLL